MTRVFARSWLWFAAFLFIVLAAPTNIGAKSQSLDWKTFVSVKAFSVDYPASWVSIDDSGGRLDILSSSVRLTAVVIARGESEISVDEMSPPPRTEMYPKYLEEKYDVVVYDSRTIVIPGGERDDACRAVDIGSWDFDVAPNAIQVNTTLTCRIGARWFEVRLTRWKADGKSTQDESLAFKMISSLRAAAR